MGLIDFVKDEDARKAMKRNASDLAQSASNAAAENVTGLVDLSALLLRGLGLPIPKDAVLSSEWAKHHGLMIEVPHSPAQVAGETLGLLAPVAVVNRARKAAGLLGRSGMP